MRGKKRVVRASPSPNIASGVECRITVNLSKPSAQENQNLGGFAPGGRKGARNGPNFKENQQRLTLFRGLSKGKGLNGLMQLYQAINFIDKEHSA